MDNDTNTLPLLILRNHTFLTSLRAGQAPCKLQIQTCGSVGILTMLNLPAKPNKACRITAVIASKKQNQLKHVSQTMMESQNMKRKRGVMTCIALPQAPLGQLR